MNTIEYFQNMIQINNNIQDGWDTEQIFNCFEATNIINYIPVSKFLTLPQSKEYMPFFTFIANNLKQLDVPKRKQMLLMEGIISLNNTPEVAINAVKRNYFTPFEHQTFIETAIKHKNHEFLGYVLQYKKYTKYLRYGVVLRWAVKKGSPKSIKHIVSSINKSNKHDTFTDIIHLSEIFSMDQMNKHVSVVKQVLKIHPQKMFGKHLELDKDELNPLQQQALQEAQATINNYHLMLLKRIETKRPWQDEAEAIIDLLKKSPYGKLLHK